jgi:succinate dehydrogenase/fumarate reductase flavoprotein subunit
MVAFFRAHTSLEFVSGSRIPDFHDRSPGAGAGGRSVCAAPFDGRALGRRIKLLRPPLEEVAPFGMGIASGADMQHFFSATRSWRSFAYVARRVLRHQAERLAHGQGLWLVGGNALVARLLKSADDLKVTILTATPARAPILERGRVAGVVVGEGERVLARRGMVLATGGFPHDDARRAAMFPHAPTGREHVSAAPATNTGDGLSIGEAAGGSVRTDLSNAGAWAPVSLAPRGDGTFGRFPHLVERAKPGLIMVTRDGRRFANEADSCHDVMQALFAVSPKSGPVEAWIICDHDFQRRYGLGRARPRPFPVRPWLANNYLKRGATLEELAHACGIDDQGLAETVRIYNEGAARGRDDAFHRGESAYNRVQGEPDHKPNPCVAPILRAPFYAVKIAPGSLGTFAGLRTDASARVLDREGRPIEGLFAVGNDMSSMMGGRYPAGGITLGPAMTFGFVAAHVASGAPLDGKGI